MTLENLAELQKDPSVTPTLGRTCTLKDKRNPQQGVAQTRKEEFLNAIQLEKNVKLLKAEVKAENKIKKHELLDKTQRVSPQV